MSKLNWDLLKAVERGASSKHIARLLRNGAIPIQVDKFRRGTPLMWAAKNNDSETIKLLLDASASLESECVNGQTALHWAAVYGSKDAVLTLIKGGFDPNKREGGFYGDTPLIEAVRFSRVGVIPLLVENGADIDGRNHLEQTALMIAAEWQRPKCIVPLLKLGASSSCKSLGGISAFQYARDNGMDLEFPTKWNPTVRILEENGICQ